MKKVILATAALVLLSSAANAQRAPAEPGARIYSREASVTRETSTPRVEVRGTRVHAKEIVPSAASDLDLGPTPAVGSSRVIDRAEIERAFTAASLPVPKKIPAAVRVARKTRRLQPADVNGAVKVALADMKIPRGAALTNIRSNGVEVPADFQKVSVELPTLPRKAGTVTVQAHVTFLSDETVAISKAIVPIDFTLPPEAAFAEITKGAPITLIIKKGLVEVAIGAVAASDGDVGSIVPVTLKPSGRVLRARAIDNTHAVAVEE